MIESKQSKTQKTKVISLCQENPKQFLKSKMISKLSQNQMSELKETQKINVNLLQSFYLKPLVFQFVAVFLPETTPVSTIITCVQSLYLKPLVLQNAVITFVQFLYLRPLVPQIAIVTLTQVIYLGQKIEINAQNKFAVCASIRII